MQVVLHSVNEELHDVFRGWGSFGRLTLHYWQQFRDDFSLLISGQTKIKKSLILVSLQTAIRAYLIILPCKEV